MLQSAPTARATAPPGGRRDAARDVFVMLAMSLVVIAFAAGLHLQLDVAGPAAITAGATAWVAFLILHLIVRRSHQHSGAVSADLRGRTGTDTPDLKQALPPRPVAAAARMVRAGGAAQTGGTSAKPPPLPPLARAQADSTRQANAGLSHAGATALAAARDRADGHGQMPSDLGWNLRPGTQREQPATSPRSAAFPSLDTPATGMGGGAAPQTVQRREPPQRDAGAIAGAKSAAPREPTAGAVADDAAAQARAAELRSMQSLIEQIAKQLTAPQDPVTPNAGGGGAAQAATPDQAIAQSVEALKAAGSAMRATSPGAKAETARTARERPVADTPVTPQQIVEAISAERLDTYLDYVFGLDDRKARHFDISVRIRTEDGRSLRLADCGQLLASSGLHGRFDSARIALLAKIGERLNSRGTSALLFSSIAPQSLIDVAFLDACARMLKSQPGVSGQLVLSLSQNDLRVFSKPQWETLSKLAENGVHFAIEDLSDMAMDFALLRTRRFAFIRADAGTLLAGMRDHDGPVSAAQACKRLAETGFSVIARAIHDEPILAQVQRLGVPYGQGTLFGVARPVKIDLKQREAAA